jgi:hypothetical protein
VLGEFVGVLCLEAWMFFGGVEVEQSILGDLVAGLGVLLENLPVMGLLFHLMLLGFDVLRFRLAFLRFEANFDFALFGS